MIKGICRHDMYMAVVIGFQCILAPMNFSAPFYLFRFSTVHATVSWSSTLMPRIKAFCRDCVEYIQSRYIFGAGPAPLRSLLDAINHSNYCELVFRIVRLSVLEM